MHALIRALIVSRMRGASKTAVVGLPGVSVVYDNTERLQHVIVTFPNGESVSEHLIGDTDEEVAADAARFLGLA